ncbi:hypothetical protein JCM11491_002541 [Sporobolomyces phaffii]
MESETDQPEQKKRRVTKACDQCRKRRIKCQSFPNVAIDAPCVICTEANQAGSCTYTRPTRKRGPQPGKSKSLQEKCEVLERLIGHLLLALPSVGPHIETFFRYSTADSPDVASPSSSSSSTTHPTTVQQQVEAYRSSRIAQQLEGVAGSPSVQSAPAAKARETSRKRAKQDPESPAPSSSASVPTPSPSIASFSSPRVASGHRAAQPFAPSTISSTSQYDIPTNALHALAHAAVPDQEQAMEGVVNTVVQSSPFGRGGSDRNSRHEIPLLPSESVRNHLLDLYFNQVVQPYFPMLDKTLFLRWSAHLPAVPTRTTTSLPSSRLIPPPLYLAVFALAASYLPPSVAVSTHPPSVWAEAARAHLWTEIEKTPNLETVQAAIIGSIIDWGAGELNRAWIVSSIAVALSINQSLHLASHNQPDPNSLKLKTFHSALIIHTLLSLRLSRAPLIVLEDYNVPIPPIDGNEDFELWRSDKTSTELREDWKPTDHTDLVDSPQLQTAPLPSVRAPQAVRSASLSTFARMASLCAIGLTILRWDVCPRRGYGQSLATGEQERVELVESLRGWGDDLENELRLGGDASGGIERLEERARWTVEMHLVLAALNLKLRPHASFASTAFDPVPTALVLLQHVLVRYRSLYTMYRSLPIIDFSLHTLSSTLFQQSDYAPHQHDAPLKAYEELSRLFPVSKTCLDTLKAKVDGHKRELGLLRGVHPTASTAPPPATPSNEALSEPFQAFLSYSADLGPSASPQTVLDFGSWDQTDLLFSLGLVGNPNDSMNGWGLPEAQDGLPLPPLIEADFSTLEGGSSNELRYPPANMHGGASAVTASLDQAMLNFGPSGYDTVSGGGRGRGPGAAPTFPLPSSHHQGQPQYGASMFQPLEPVDRSLRTPFHPSSSSSSISMNPHHPSYPSAHFFSGPSPGPGGGRTEVTDAVGDRGGGGDSTTDSGERSTDLLTRWLGRGAVSLEGFTGDGVGGGMG